MRVRLDPANPPQLTADDRRLLEGMTDAEITAAALDDPDNPPLTEEELVHLDRAARARGRGGEGHTRAPGATAGPGRPDQES